MSIESKKQEVVQKIDSSLRCPRCAGLISAYKVSCDMGENTTVKVADFARCINTGSWSEPDRRFMGACEAIFNLKLVPGVERYGITKNGILKCLKQSRGYFYTLKELKQGHLDLVDMPKSYRQEQEIVNPPNWNEPQETEIF